MKDEVVDAVNDDDDDENTEVETRDEDGFEDEQL